MGALRLLARHDNTNALCYALAMTQNPLLPDKELVFGAGRTLFKQGDQDRELYFVTKGEIDLIVRDESTGAEVIIETIKEKSVLGTMSFLEGLPRSATAVTKTEVRLVKVNQTVRDKIFKSIPPWFNVLVKELTATIRRLDQKYLRLTTELENCKKQLAIKEKQIEELRAKNKTENPST